MRLQPKLWDNQREREKKRENFPTKSSNLKHSLAHSQNKGLSEHQRRASQLWICPPLLEAERQAGDSQRWKARGYRGPRDGILHQTLSRLPVANHVFLGSWTVDVCQERHSLRSAPQRRHTVHLRQCSCGTPRSGQDQGSDKMHCPTWDSALTTHLVA